MAALQPGTRGSEAALIEAPALSFLPGVAEKLGYYVYALRDPEGRIFYVGKGKGDRVYQHAALARKVEGETAGQLKLETIRKLHELGQEVVVDVIRHRLTDEEAYEVEAAVIDALRLAGVDLTNAARGKWATSQGWLPLEELRARYAATPVAIDDRVVLIRINKLFRHGMSEEELYTATRQWWVMNPQRKPEFALAVFNGVVRAAYKIDPNGWRRDNKTGRWQFAGSRDVEAEEKYAWRDVRAYARQGAQNPIKYVNC